MLMNFRIFPDISYRDRGFVERKRARSWCPAETRRSGVPLARVCLRQSACELLVGHLVLVDYRMFIPLYAGWGYSGIWALPCSGGLQNVHSALCRVLVDYRIFISLFDGFW